MAGGPRALTQSATAVLASALAPGNNSYDRRVAVTVYALVAAAMSASRLPVFPYLRDHPELAESTGTAEYFRAQSLRPAIGVALYGLAVPVVWFLGPAAGLSFFVIMIVFHAVTSEGLQQGPLSRLFLWRVLVASSGLTGVSLYVSAETRDNGACPIASAF